MTLKSKQAARKIAAMEQARQQVTRSASQPRAGAGQWGEQGTGGAAAESRAAGEAGMTEMGTARCGCTIERVAANRADRRAAAKAGRPTPQGVQLHQDGCPVASSAEGLMRGRVRAAKSR